MDEDIKVLIREAYDDILQTTMKVLRNCELFKFNMDLLKEEDPSYSIIAQKLELAAEFIKASYSVMSHKDTESMHNATKAFEYALNVKNIARAISEDNQESLEDFLTELKEKPFL